MNRRISLYITILLAGILGLSSCTKKKLETTYTNQESKIDQYITKNKYTNAEKTDSLRVVNFNGSNRLVKTEGTGEELSSTGTVAFYYAGYVFNGSKSPSSLFVTNHKETATAAGWNLTDEQFTIYQINMADVKLITGLWNGLLGVKAGETSEILFSGKYGFGNKEVGIIPANSALLYEIWVEAVSNE